MTAEAATTPSRFVRALLVHDHEPLGEDETRAPKRNCGWRMLRRELPDGWDRGLPMFPTSDKGVATRDANGQVLNAVARNVTWIIGGSWEVFEYHCRKHPEYREEGCQPE